MFSDWNFPASVMEPLTEVTTAGEEDDNCFECSRCNKAYKTLKSLRRHRFHCGRTFDPIVRGFVQNYDETDDQAQFQCVYCNRAYRWKKGLKRHQQRCEIKMAQEIPSENNLEVNIIEGSNPVEHEIDITGDDNDDDFDDNEDNDDDEDDDDDDDEIKITHTVPPRGTTNENTITNTTRKSTSEIMRNRDASVGRFQCILCGKKYGWLKNLRRHQRICRKKVSKHRWKECKVMIEPLSLKTQKRITEQNFKCSICFEQFKWLRELRQHQSICMKKSQNFWNVSETKNSTKNQLNLKARNSTTENLNHINLDPCYKCAFCFKEYKWRRSLRRHYPKCTERGDKPLNVPK